ncbi:MAG: response regulator [Spirochaetia bacterium]|nr:response regulator [Spirochaetia bacterium]
MENFEAVPKNPSPVTVLLVDDEKKIRQGLLQIVNWDDLGYKVSGSCENGYEAVLFIQKNPVDVVITDIKMPRMSGIELMDYLRIHNPEIKIIILSGYDEFEYVKEALSCGALDYILKPTNIDELEQILDRTKELIVKEQKQKQMKIEAEFQRNQELIKYLLGHRDIQNPHIIRYINSSHYPEIQTASFLTSIFIQIDNRSYHHSIDSQKEIISFINNIPFSLSTRLSASDFVCIAASSPEEIDSNAFMNRIMQVVNSIVGRFRTDAAIKNISIGIGEYCTDLIDLQKTVQHSRIACNYSFYHQVNSRIMLYNDLANDQQTGSFPNAFGKEISNLLLQSEQHLIPEYLNYLFNDYIPIRKPLLEEILDGVLEMLIFTFSTLKDMRIDPKKMFVHMPSPMVIIQETTDLKTLQIELQNIFSTISSYLESNAGFTQIERKVYAIQEYIKEHCTEHISLNDLSNQFSLSPDYISRSFKQVTKINLTTSIATHRIEYAKSLVRKHQDKRFTEIAELAGFTDVKYFIKVFKKIVGKSPSEYRASLPLSQN